MRTCTCSAAPRSWSASTCGRRRTQQDLAARLRAYAATLPKGRWITGGYWDHEAWPGKALPTRALLDAVTPDHPVFVQRLDGHMAVANSLALRLAGVTTGPRSPDGGTIVRDAPASRPRGSSRTTRWTS